MTRLILLSALAALSVLAQHRIDDLKGSSNVEFRLAGGTTAPSSGTCDSSAETRSIYVQTDNPANINSVVWVCRQTGAASFAWMRVSHIVQDGIPAKCAIGDVWFDSNATAGSNWFGCTASDTWTLLGGGGTWGSITGTLADQTDLQSALDAKQASDADLTTLAGKTIAGNGTNVRLSSGSYTTNDCVKVDASGNFVTAGAACGSGSAGSILGPETIASGASTATITHNLGLTAPYTLPGLTCSRVDGGVTIPVIPANFTGSTANALVINLSGNAASDVQCVAAVGAVGATGAAGQDASVASTSNVLKGDGAGAAVAATPGTDYVVPAGNVATATALAANGANCSAGSYPLGVDASGAVEGCTAVGASHTQNTDTGTTATCFQLDNDASGPKICHDASSGYQVKTSADVVLMTVDSAGVLTLGDGTSPWNLTGITDDVAPSAPASANQFTSYVDRSSGLLAWILNGGSAQYVASGNSSGASTLAPTEAYDATGWNGDTAPPQKDAVRDKIETLAPLADPVFTGSVSIPNGTGPTVNAAGEIAVDTTTDQLRYYGSAERVLPSIQSMSFVIPAPATTDDINIMKAPYGMTIVGIDAIVQGTTSATGQLQECAADGTSCADLDSDIVADADGAADDGSLTDSTIASGAWLRWKTTSVSGTPTFLTVTVRYRVVAD